MKDFIHWIKLFFFLKKQRKEFTHKNLNHYSKGLASSCSRAFGYKFRECKTLKFTIEEVLFEIEEYHKWHNNIYENVKKAGKLKLDWFNYEFEDCRVVNPELSSTQILEKIKN